MNSLPAAGDSADLAVQSEDAVNPLVRPCRILSQIVTATLLGGLFLKALLQ